MQNIDERGGWTHASNAQYDLLCQGRHQAQKGLEETRSADASHGDAVHAALFKGDWSALPVDQADIAQSCSDIEGFVVATFFGTAPAECYRERRFRVSFPRPGLPPVGHSGKFDVVYRHGPRALVIDYKSLAGEVADSPRNQQLRDGAVLVRGELAMVSEVGTAIVQPLVTHKPEVCLYSAADLQRAQVEMAQRVIASNAPDAKRTAGDLQCKFCLAKTKCPEYAKYSGALIPPASKDDALLREVLFTRAMELWTPEQRAMAAGMLAPAAKALDQIRDFLERCLAQDSESVPGWFMKAGNITESVKDPTGVYNRFIAAGGTTEQFMAAVKITKGTLLEQLKTASGLKGKALKDKMESLLDGLTESKQNKASLARKDA